MVEGGGVCAVGRVEGEGVGRAVGTALGWGVGSAEGERVGRALEAAVGSAEGGAEGCGVGLKGR